jgi:hypothetical protein
MKNTNLLIGVGVVIVGYLLYKKSVKSKEMKCNNKYNELQLEKSERFQIERYVSPEEEMNKKRQWMKMNCK